MKMDGTSDYQIEKKLGFGCGRLVGGSSFKQSALLVEKALDLGIRHFDVAPSYGLGMAENVLGAVLASVNEANITTKVGIARPSGGQGLSVMRKYLGPILKSSKFIKSMVLNVLATRSEKGVFDVESVTASFEESLRRLKRDKINALLLHEPSKLDITDELIKYGEMLKSTGQVDSLGLGFNDACFHNECVFGSVIQRNIGSLLEGTNVGNRYQIVHGTMRSSCELITGMFANNNKSLFDSFEKLGWDVNDKSLYGSAALGMALSNNSIDIILVSFSDVNRMIQTIDMAKIFYGAINDIS